MNGVDYDGSLLIVDKLLMSWSPQKFSEIKPGRYLVFSINADIIVFIDLTLTEAIYYLLSTLFCASFVRGVEETVLNFSLT